MIKFVKYILISCFLFLANSFFAHDYYVSITTVDIKEDQHIAQIAIKITAHDLENSLIENGFPDLKLGSTKEVPEASNILSNYITKHLKFWINEKLSHLEYIGREIENSEDLWLYFECTLPHKVKTLKIFNDILVQTFPGQHNILHLNYTSSPMSFTFTENNREKTIQAPEKK